jgi:hypothetical protein
MKIEGMVHCFFEQSGTFKNEFRKLGIPAEDYDIQNNFGETDHIVDLFGEIEKAYGGGCSLFDMITKDDLIIAFFPCIEFSCVAQMWFSEGQRDYRNWGTKRMFDYMLAKSDKRNYMFNLLYKFVGVCKMRELRMVFENPWGLNTYLKQNVFIKPPSVIDTDRTKRGDFRIKPTAYWFWNCEPTQAISCERPHREVKNHNQLKKAPKAGICSEERSMIEPCYARNFIADFILGKPLGGRPQQQDLFAMEG